MVPQEKKEELLADLVWPSHCIFIKHMFSLQEKLKKSAIFQICRKTERSSTAFTSIMSRNWSRRKRFFYIKLTYLNPEIILHSGPGSTWKVANDKNGSSPRNDLDWVPPSGGHVRHSKLQPLIIIIQGTRTWTTWRLSLTLWPRRRLVKAEREGPWGSPRSAGNKTTKRLQIGGCHRWSIVMWFAT